MLRAVPMAHFRVQVPSRDAPAAARAIANEGLLHLVDIAHGRTPYDASPPGTRELHAAFRDLANRVRMVAERLDLKLAEPEGSLRAEAVDDFAAERDRLLTELEPVEKRVEALWRAGSAARQRLAELQKQLAVAERLGAAGIDLARLVPLRFVTVRLMFAGAEAQSNIGGMLAPAPFAVIPLDGGDPQLVAAVVANFARTRLEEAMRVALVQPIALPQSAEAWQTAQLQRECEEAQRAEEQARRDLEEEGVRCGETLKRIAQRAELGALLLQAQTLFAASGHFVVISGWLPAEAAERMRTKIRAATHDHAVIEIERAENVPGVAEGSVRVPILHRNPLLLRPFQRLVEIYGTPSYGEVQPTAFFAISFLLMFGLMFGDAGHGAVLFAAGWFLFRYLTQYLDYGILLMEAGASSTLFGVLYGSVFGLHDLLPTLWLEPMADLRRFMVVAVALGVVLVTGGLILNIINTWRSGEIRDALIGPRGLTGAMLYWIVLVLLARIFLPATARIPSAFIVALAVTAIALLAGGGWLARRIGKGRAKPPVRTSPVWLTALERSVEIVDSLFSYFANTISFVRVAAFAAVHAGVFIAIFALADTLASMRMGGALAVIVHVAGNALMILLEGLTVSVQVLRLEYYEFFGKFFRGGGEPYAPLDLRALEKKHA